MRGKENNLAGTGDRNTECLFLYSKLNIFFIYRNSPIVAYRFSFSINLVISLLLRFCKDFSDHGALKISRNHSFVTVNDLTTDNYEVVRKRSLKSSSEKD